MKTMKNKSPLGDKAPFYIKKSVSRGAIQDHPEEGWLEFYPAGYSHVSRRDGVARQIRHKNLYQHAVHYRTENRLYPFKLIEHDIELVPDKTNPVDKNAMWVILKSKFSEWRDLNNTDLGFVPREISQVIRNNIQKITGGTIYKIKSDFYKKFYTCKIVLFYRNVPHPQNTGVDRFQSIIMES